MIHQKLSLSLTAALMLSACSMIPTYETPKTDIPQGWSEASATAETKIAKDWWKNFKSAELDTLMTRALSYNNDLAAARARVEQSRALARVAGAPLLPALNGTAGATYEKTNPDSGSSTTVKTGTGGLAVSYELDVFGKNSAALQAAEENTDAAEYTKDSTALVVMSEVAKGYFNVLNLQERLSVADQNLQSAKDLMKIVQARFDAGVTTQLDVAQQKADVAATQASRASVEQQLKAAKNALAVLVGLPPQSLVITGKDLKSVIVPELATTQPSILLTRRPDIAAAEAALKSSNADIGAARAAFFPSLTLGLEGALSSVPIGDPVTTIASASSGLLAPIFSGGLLEGNLAYSKARKEELTQTYKKAVLVAFQEVDNALTSVNTAQTRETALQTAYTESQNAYTLSQQQYDAGAIDFQSLLEIRRTMLSAQDSFVQSKNDRLAAATDLYKALGGGWESAQ